MENFHLKRSGPEPLILSEAEREERFLISGIITTIDIINVMMMLMMILMMTMMMTMMTDGNKVEAASSISARASRTRRKTGHSPPHVSIIISMTTMIMMIFLASSVLVAEVPR